MNERCQEPAIRIERLGTQDYMDTWRRMQRFTDERHTSTEDRIWLLQHRPVFTQGQAGKAEHLLAPGDIPVVQSDRGGQITYHGPGQLIVYPLLDLRRRAIGVRPLVTLLEHAIMKLLAGYGIEGVARADAPGVYVAGRKIASLGLRVRRGCCYHGLSLNVAMDLSPFERINPCGHPGLELVQLSDLGGPRDLDLVGETLAGILVESLQTQAAEKGVARSAD